MHHLRVSSILKVILKLISKKTRINDIGLNVEKGLRDDMIVNDIVISVRLYECEGCRKQFARMDALNRHLKSETGVECARVVERNGEWIWSRG